MHNLQNQTERKLTPAERQKIHRKAFKPLAEELGWLVFHWNTLHETLCELYADLTDDRYVSYAVWHSAVNDRPQREMLQSGAKALAKISKHEHDQRLCAGILWILEKLKGLAGNRNDALHSPLIFVHMGWRDSPIVEIEPNCRSGNPRAASLDRTSEPLDELFAWYRDHLERLALFANELHYAWLFRKRADSPYAWPDKPLLPSRGHYRKPEKSRRKSGCK